MSLKRAPNFPWTGERAKVYTYALSGLSGGRNYDGSDQEILEARAALRVLVTEITRFPVLASLAPEYVRSANIFCLPFVDKNRTDTDVLPGFDFDLASNYRTYIARLLSDQPNLASRLAGPGPFPRVA